MLLSSLDLNEMLPFVSRSLQAALPHDHVAICLYDARTGGLLDYTATSEVKRKVYPANGVLPLEESLNGQVFREGKARVYNHAELLVSPSR